MLTKEQYEAMDYAYDDWKDRQLHDSTKHYSYERSATPCIMPPPPDTERDLPPMREEYESSDSWRAIVQTSVEAVRVGR